MIRFVIPLFLVLSLSFTDYNATPSFSVSATAVDVLTQHNDNQRTGANLTETVLNTRNVHLGSFGKLFTRQVDGQIYAQPLYMPGVNVPAKGIHNVIYVATQHNSVYAFDADDPLASTPLWHVNLGQSAPTPADFGNRYGPYNDISPEVGITSTPVIDPVTNTLYVVSFVRDTPLATPCPCVYHHDLHALDITSGADKLSKRTIAGSMPGTGYDSSSGTVTFHSHEQLQRSSLLLLNGIVYVAFASYGDTDPYHGWIFGYNSTTLSLASIFNVTPNGQEGGIWQSGQGPSADSTGYIYLITGNGTFDAPGGGDYGDSFLKFNPQNVQNGLLPVVDWFTPYNQSTLSSTDLDVGSTGALLIPGTNIIVGGGKEGILYLVDKTNMSHYHGPSGPDMVVQHFPVTPPTPLFNSPIFWDRPGNRVLYIWGISGPLHAYNFNGSVLDYLHPIVGSTSLSQAYPGGALSLSANGGDPNTGIVWASHPVPGSNTQGVLRAYNAADITQELWNSEANPTLNDRVGGHAKFNAPTIANGKVYLGTTSNQLVVYGLILTTRFYLPVIYK